MSIDQNVLDSERWMKNIGKVNECCAVMEVLMDEYGSLDFGAALRSFYETIDEDLMKEVERARYQNTKLADHQSGKQSTSGKWFRQ